MSLYPPQEEATIEVRRAKEGRVRVSTVRIEQMSDVMLLGSYQNNKRPIAFCFVPE